MVTQLQLFAPPKLDDFTLAYIEAALWSSNGDDDTPLDANYSRDNLARETLDDMAADCARFQRENATDLAGRKAQHGHDFWLTRNGHGAGFWDRGLGDRGDRLTEAADEFGEVYLYVGDDGRIYS